MSQTLLRYGLNTNKTLNKNFSALNISKFLSFTLGLKKFYKLQMLYSGNSAVLFSDICLL